MVGQQIIGTNLFLKLTLVIKGRPFFFGAYPTWLTPDLMLSGDDRSTGTDLLEWALIQYTLAK